MMTSLLSLTALVAIVIPKPALSPSAPPSPAPATLKTIITVKTTPYCNALAQHFNSALVPMIGNDRTLDQVNTNLLDINDAFSHPDFAERLLKDRDALQRYDRNLLTSLGPIPDQIDALRDGQRTTSDPDAAKQLRDAAEQLQTAYVKQKQLAIDLQGLVQAMMESRMYYGDHPLNGNSMADNALPSDMKDIKSYLRFDGQRDVIAGAEAKAIDIAYDAAMTQCAK